MKKTATNVPNRCADHSRLRAPENAVANARAHVRKSSGFQVLASHNSGDPDPDTRCWMAAAGGDEDTKVKMDEFREMCPKSYFPWSIFRPNPDTRKELRSSSRTRAGGSTRNWNSSSFPDHTDSLSRQIFMRRATRILRTQVPDLSSGN